jgi:uncharacterized protein YccT (UPF0319 family)
MVNTWYGLIAFFLILGISFPAYSASEIIIPEQFDIIEHNEKPYHQGMFEQDKRLVVEPGIHKFILQYSDVIDLADGEFEKVVSRDIIVVLDVQDNYRYILTSRRPSRLEEAREFANSPVYNIERVALSGNGNDRIIVSESKELQKLKAIWLDASEQEKQKFKAWIQGEENNK